MDECSVGVWCQKLITNDTLIIIGNFANVALITFKVKDIHTRRIITLPSALLASRQKCANLSG